MKKTFKNLILLLFLGTISLVPHQHCCASEERVDRIVPVQKGKNKSSTKITEKIIYGCIGAGVFAITAWTISFGYKLSVHKDTSLQEPNPNEKKEGDEKHLPGNKNTFEQNPNSAEPKNHFAHQVKEFIELAHSEVVDWKLKVEEWELDYEKVSLSNEAQQLNNRGPYALETLFPNVFKLDTENYEKKKKKFKKRLGEYHLKEKGFKKRKKKQEENLSYKEKEQSILNRRKTLTEKNTMLALKFSEFLIDETFKKNIKKLEEKKKLVLSSEEKALTKKSVYEELSKLSISSIEKRLNELFEGEKEEELNKVEAEIEQTAEDIKKLNEEIEHNNFMESIRETLKKAKN